MLWIVNVLHREILLFDIQLCDPSLPDHKKLHAYQKTINYQYRCHGLRYTKKKEGVEFFFNMLRIMG